MSDVCKPTALYLGDMLSRCQFQGSQKKPHPNTTSTYIWYHYRNTANFAGDLEIKSPRPVGVPSLRLENLLSTDGFRSHGVGSELAPGADLRAPFVEDEQNRYHDGSEAAE
jgi:hypothetical protein